MKKHLELLDISGCKQNTKYRQFCNSFLPFNTLYLRNRVFILILAQNKTRALKIHSKLFPGISPFPVLQNILMINRKQLKLTKKMKVFNPKALKKQKIKAFLKFLPWNKLKCSIVQEEPLHNHLVAPVNGAACELNYRCKIRSSLPGTDSAQVTDTKKHFPPEERSSTTFLSFLRLKVAERSLNGTNPAQVTKYSLIGAVDYSSITR